MSMEGVTQTEQMRPHSAQSNPTTPSTPNLRLCHLHPEELSGFFRCLEDRLPGRGDPGEP